MAAWDWYSDYHRLYGKPLEILDGCQCHRCRGVLVEGCELLCCTGADAVEAARQRLAEIEADRSKLVSGDDLAKGLQKQVLFRERKPTSLAIPFLLQQLARENTILKL